MFNPFYVAIPCLPLPNRTMNSFKSKYYPRSGNKVFMFQEYAVRYYGIFFAVYFIYIALLIFQGGEIGIGAIIGLLLCLVFGNFFTYAFLKRKIAEVFFVDETVTVITIYDILFREPGKPFPLRLVNPFRTGNEITFTFQDQILSLEKEDWEGFELLWESLNQYRGHPENPFVE